MKNKCLTLSIITKNSGANYGEGFGGNISTLKKTTINHKQYAYISRQAIRHDLMEQLGTNVTPCVDCKDKGEKDTEDKQDKQGVIQYAKEANIADYPEIDYFGYMKTTKDSSATTRKASVRISDLISYKPYAGDMDFLTNADMAKRAKRNNNIAQTEISTGFFHYTILVDLEKIGVDENDTDIVVSKEEKIKRVMDLLDAVLYLNRDCKGKTVNLNPVFIVGGIYPVRNPVFDNSFKVNEFEDTLEYSAIHQILKNPIYSQTEIGMLKGNFDNESDIETDLNTVSPYVFINNLKERVKKEYESDTN